MKKALFVILLFVATACYSQQDTTQQDQSVITLSVKAVQPFVYSFGTDTTKNFQEGIILFIPGEMLNQKPLTINEIIARISYLSAALEARKEK